MEAKNKSVKHVPMRLCIGCRAGREKREMVRIVKKPDGGIVLDRTGRQNGRGAYLCDSADCFHKARKGGALARSFRMNIPDHIYDELEEQWNE